MTPLRALALCLILVGFPAGAEAVPWLFFSNRLEFGWDEPSRTRRLDDWLDARAQDRLWRAHLRLRARQVGGAGAAGGDSVGVEQRSLTLDTGSLEVTAGTYYRTLGRGLVLRLHENRFVTLGRSDRSFSLDRDADGALVRAAAGPVEVTALSGLARLTIPNGGSAGQDSGRRIDLLQAVSGQWRWGGFTAGGTVLGAERRSVAREEFANPRQTLRSARGGWQGSPGSVFVEWADIQWHGARPTLRGGRALYGELTAGAGAWAMSLEYKNYDTYSFPYAEPPTLVRTHSSVLLNASTHVLRPTEEGFQLEALRADGDVTTTLNLTGAWSGFRGRGERFREAFLEHRSEGEPVVWITFADWSEETKVSGREDRWTLGGSVEPSLDPDWSLFGDLEIQRAVPDRTPAFTNGFAQIGGSRAGMGTAALRVQWTSRAPVFEDEKTVWVGGTLNLQISGHHSLFVFGGTRPAGLVCSGGFCFFAPEFEGVEARLLSNF